MYTIDRAHRSSSACSRNACPGPCTEARCKGFCAATALLMLAKPAELPSAGWSCLRWTRRRTGLCCSAHGAVAKLTMVCCCRWSSRGAAECSAVRRMPAAVGMPCVAVYLAVSSSSREGAWASLSSYVKQQPVETGIAVMKLLQVPIASLSASYTSNASASSRWRHALMLSPVAQPTAPPQYQAVSTTQIEQMLLVNASLLQDRAAPC